MYASSLQVNVWRTCYLHMNLFQLLLLLLRLRLLILRQLVQLLVQLLCRLAIPQKHQHKLGVHLPRYKCSPH